LKTKYSFANLHQQHMQQVKNL